MKRHELRIAILGGGGLVGKELEKILRYEGKFHEDQLLITRLFPQILERKPHITFSALPTEVALEWVPKFVEAGSIVIDKSSAFRKDANVPLIVPEVNSLILSGKERLIATPNCTTTQLVVALAPLKKYGLKRIVVSTYQAASGAGVKGLNQLRMELGGKHIRMKDRAFFCPLPGNVIPECGEFMEDGFTDEEHKLKDETRRILCLPNLKIHATAARVPVEIGHSISAHIEFEQPITKSQLAECYPLETPGLQLMDQPWTHGYPTPLRAAGGNYVLVGRLRVDPDEPTHADIWISADNLRKGAALNAWQIMEHILKLKGWSE